MIDRYNFGFWSIFNILTNSFLKYVKKHTDFQNNSVVLNKIFPENDFHKAFLKL